SPPLRWGSAPRPGAASGGGAVSAAIVAYTRVWPVPAAAPPAAPATAPSTEFELIVEFLSDSAPRLTMAPPARSPASPNTTLLESDDSEMSTACLASIAPATKPLPRFWALLPEISEFATTKAPPSTSRPPPTSPPPAPEAEFPVILQFEMVVLPVPSTTTGAPWEFANGAGVAVFPVIVQFERARPPLPCTTNAPATVDVPAAPVIV